MLTQFTTARVLKLLHNCKVKLKLQCSTSVQFVSDILGNKMTLLLYDAIVQETSWLVLKSGKLGSVKLGCEQLQKTAWTSGS